MTIKKNMTSKKYLLQSSLLKIIHSSLSLGVKQTHMCEILQYSWVGDLTFCGWQIEIIVRHIQHV